MPYVRYTEDQIRRANTVDLADYLRAQGENVKRSGRDWRWERHDSVAISGNRWYRHSESVGGTAIGFVQKFYNLSFPEAIATLLGGEGGVSFAEAGKLPPPAPKPFKLPEAHADTRRAFAYLSKARCIERGIIQHFIKAGTLYEDARHHNAVFIGTDELGVPRHAHKRSTYTEGKSYRGNAGGSDARYSFRHVGHGALLYVFEAPVDMLSFLTMHPDRWQEQSYVSLCGLSPQAMMWVLKQNPGIRRILLCPDNDAAGTAAIERLTETLQQAGYMNVGRLVPVAKDWNEDLKTSKTGGR